MRKIFYLILCKIFYIEWSYMKNVTVLMIKFDSGFPNTPKLRRLMGVYFPLLFLTAKKKLPSPSLSLSFTLPPTSNPPKFPFSRLPARASAYRFVFERTDHHLRAGASRRLYGDIHVNVAVDVDVDTHRQRY